MNFEQLKKEVNERLIQREGEMIKIRRHFHENPELSFQEKETSAFIANFYKDKDCEMKTNFGGGYGIIIDIKGGKPGNTIALRADMDALPINENTNVDFKSKKPGIMHACGHDGHTAYLMVLADILIELKEELPGNIRIIHQPAEETSPGGAKGMVEAGCLEGVDKIIAAHFMTNFNLGEIGYRQGPIQTGRATFKVAIEGKGGHGSAPHESNDAIVGVSYFVTSLQTIISRRVNPFDTATVTVGSFDGKGNANTIKQTVELEGDIRLMQEENRPLIQTEFKTILDGVCKTFRLKNQLNYVNDYPVLVNDEALTDMVVKAIEDAKIENVTKVFKCNPQTASEDFAYYAQEIPACMFYIGAIKKGDPSYPHHHPDFYINEESILIMARAVGNSALYYLFKGVCN